MTTILNIHDLDFLTVKGIKEIVQYNRDIIQGYGNTTRLEYYKLFNRLLEKGMTIKVPFLTYKDYKIKPDAFIN